MRRRRRRRKRRRKRRGSRVGNKEIKPHTGNDLKGEAALSHTSLSSSEEKFTKQ